MTASAVARLARVPLLEPSEIAAICHDANRRLCLALGDASQPLWEDAEAWAAESALTGVMGILDGRITKPEDSHASWMAQKRDDGWTFGPVKDPAKKEHPCMVPFVELPRAQQWKDHLFLAIVCSLSIAEPGLPETVTGRTVEAGRGFPTDDLLVASVNRVRGTIKDTARDLKFIKDDVARGHFVQRPGEDRGEAIANLTLSYRHLEDASMRLGKAIQARDGGVSVYDKDTTVGASS